MDGLYQFIHIFKQHDIKLIFVFDGKAPDSKAPVLLQRKKVTKKRRKRPTFNRELPERDFSWEVKTTGLFRPF